MSRSLPPFKPPAVKKKLAFQSFRLPSIISWQDAEAAAVVERIVETRPDYALLLTIFDVIACFVGMTIPNFRCKKSSNR